MNDTWYIIVNPIAGRGQALRRWRALSAICDEQGIPYVHAVSAYSGHTTVLAREALHQGYRRFLSVGGDGTHHEVANGIIDRNIHDNTPIPILAVMSAGTGNDFVREHQLPHQPQNIATLLKACNTILHPAGHIRCTTDDGIHVERYFINVAGMALDGRVVEKCPPHFHRIPILPAYLLAGIRELFRYRAPRMTISTDTTVFEDTFITTHAGICRYSGGGMQFVPHANYRHATFAITNIRKLTVLRLLANLYRLYNGTILSMRGVEHSYSETLHITAHEVPVPIEADGEFLGFTPITITMVPDAFRLVVNITEPTS